MLPVAGFLMPNEGLAQFLGLDHIFDKYGNFIKDTHTGNSVKIEIDGKQYSPSQLDTSRGSRRTMSKIGAYYALQEQRGPLSGPQNNGFEKPTLLWRKIAR